MPHSFRNWTVTINNWEQSHVDALKDLPQCNYCHIVSHVAPTTGTPHIHALMQFKKAVTLKSLRDKIGPFHFEPLRDFEHFSDYMLGRGEFEGKEGVEGTLSQTGEYRANQGARNDLAGIRDSLLSGTSMPEILPDLVNYQQLRFAEGILKYVPTPCDMPCKHVLWIWGPTGSGKTRLAREIAGSDVYITSRNLKWWDGYYGQKTVIIDEFRADFCTFHELLRILDIYPFRVEYKGGSTWLMASQIIVTSCFPPERVYATREDVGQLLRRINLVRELPENVTNLCDQDN